MLRIRYIPLCGMRMVPSTTCGGPPPYELKLARRIGFAPPQLYSQNPRTKKQMVFLPLWLKRGGKEHDRALWAMQGV